MTLKKSGWRAMAGPLMFCCIIIAPSGGVDAHPPRKEVIGYFPSWKWKTLENPLTPAGIPFEKLTIINYAFFVPLADGNIAGKDTTGDRLYLRGTPATALILLAHRHGVKVVLSIGGWDDSQNFPAAASTSASRRRFAHSCADAVREYDFDGVDIDWEFPGYGDHHGTAADKANFTLLLSAVKDSLRTLGRQRQRSYILTAALPAGGENLRNIDVQGIAEILDQLNIMTYDFYGSWDPVANHNSPLFPSAGADTTRCVDAAFRLFHQEWGVPESKLNIGVPFYGHAYAQCIALNAPHAGPDTVHVPKAGLFYTDIVNIQGGMTRHWDAQASVPYLVNTEWRVLVSYDDEESIRAKARYIMDHEIHGVIIWEITGDHMPDGSTPLLDALKGVFLAGSR